MDTATVKNICQTEKKRKNGEAPLYYLIRIGCIRKKIATGHYIPPQFWDKKKELTKPGYGNSMKLNSILKKGKETLEGIIMDAQLNGQGVTHDYIISKFKKEADINANGFTAFAQTEVNKEKGILSDSTIKMYEQAIRNLDKYAPGLTFQGITVDFLERYKQYLHADCGRKPNGYVHDFTMIRKYGAKAFYNGLMKKNPFGKGGFLFPSTENTNREYLTITEKDRLYELFYSGKLEMSLYKTCYYFLFCCEIGIRFSTMLKLSKTVLIEGYDKHIDNDAIYIKHEKNGVFARIPLSDNAKDLIYKVKMDEPLKSGSSRVNNDVDLLMIKAKITKDIDFHCSRHTFAVHALNAGISLKAVSVMLGHKSIRETERTYAKFQNETLDNEIKKMNLLNKAGRDKRNSINP